MRGNPLENELLRDIKNGRDVKKYSHIELFSQNTEHGSEIGSNYWQGESHHSVYNFFLYSENNITLLSGIFFML